MRCRAQVRILVQFGIILSTVLVIDSVKNVAFETPKIVSIEDREFLRTGKGRLSSPLESEVYDYSNWTTRKSLSSTSETYQTGTTTPIPSNKASRIVSSPPYKFNSATPNKPLFRPVFTSIRNGERHLYPYAMNTFLFDRHPAFQLQFYAESEESPRTTNSTDTNYPLLVTVHWHGSVRSWEVPVQYVNSTKDFGKINRYTDNIVGKTLWHYPSNRKAANWNLTVEVSIVSEFTVYYKMRIIPVKDFLVDPVTAVSTSCTPSAPGIFRFNIPLKWKYTFIQVDSETDNCALMTLEHPSSAFLDKDESGKVHFTQTFTKKAGFNLRSMDFPDGFILKMEPFINDVKCRKSPTPEDYKIDQFRKKEINLQIREWTTHMRFFTSTVCPVVVFLGIATGSFLIFCFFHNYRLRHGNQGQVMERKSSTFHSNIMMKEVSLNEPSQVAGKSKRYFAAGCVTSIFYSVPVFQLMLTFAKQLFTTGDFDICYFNHYCAHMISYLYDFNHIYSNIWYVLFGLLFMGLVSIRHATNVTVTNESSTNDMMDNQTKNHYTTHKGSFWPLFPKIPKPPHTGAMTNYGLLYCMGYALVMTGVLSAGYHICPNQSNFQFDTAFMYTIAAVTVVTIYQSRHPTYLSASFTFTALAMVTSITVVGLLWNDFYTRISFTVIHMGFLVFSIPKVCYNGYVRRGDEVIMHWSDMMTILRHKLVDDWKHGRMLQMQRETWSDPHDNSIKVHTGHGRLLLPGFLFTNNCVSIILMWTLFLHQNFATQVLIICVLNGALYIIYYTILKIYHGECRSILSAQPMFYLILAFCLWGYAGSFFLDEVTTWEASPAESRIMNRDCTLLSFYDTHDTWHFLSALALFCSAMVLLTFDDDLLDQPHTNIPVF